MHMAPADLSPSPLLASLAVLLSHCQVFNVPSALSVFLVWVFCIGCLLDLGQCTPGSSPLATQSYPKGQEGHHLLQKVSLALLYRTGAAPLVFPPLEFLHRPPLSAVPSMCPLQVGLHSPHL